MAPITAHKTALTIAGSDTSCGAGIQADIKAFDALGVAGVCAITALTAQSSQKVEDIFPVPPPFVARQIETLFDDIDIHSVKTGMLLDMRIVEAVAHKLKLFEVSKLVVDPVIKSSSGKTLLENDAVDIMKKELLPLAFVVTPNIPEAQKLSGVKIEGMETIKNAARLISKLGPMNVVVTGGHLKGENVTDLLFTGEKFHEFTRKRIDSPPVHGTGCVFSAAITAELAKGADIIEAVKNAGLFAERLILNPVSFGKGSRSD